MMVQGLIQIEAAKLLVICNHPHDGWGLRKNGIKFLRGDSFIVRASCSADPDMRVHSISVMDPGFPVCVCGGEQMTHAHVLLQLRNGGVAVSSSIGSREEHITSTHISTSQRVYRSTCAYSTCTQIMPIT